MHADSHSSIGKLMEALHGDLDTALRAVEAALSSIRTTYSALRDRQTPRIDQYIEKDLIQLHLRAREARERLVGSQIKEAGWIMMLDLYLANRPISVSSAGISSRAPATTALRHIGLLEDAGLVVREPDKADGRRIFLNLTSRGREVIDAWLDHQLANKASARSVRTLES